ncbi:hypothetical protein HUO13_30975 [Saccharopolyspora erythraea]|uniref:DUF6461 domain-containing protein n=1 Tax=Saccharopolyspora erythraea TaxID=1836 RepID=UPI001BA90689|nr:DUF6461 domain-containing protein [Saccharopolyspora erythraea]QUH04609.1 hypothetical protein HUO13_30975 [Saccharopolyspora erythraea]
MRSNAGSHEAERFGWIHHSTIQEAACLTFVRGTDIDPVAEAFGAVSDYARELDFDEFCEESFAHHEQYSMIGIQVLGEWSLVVEDNGWQGTRDEVLRRVSAGTEAVSAFWNVDRLTRFSYAVDGELWTAFEAPLPEYRVGSRPDALEGVRAGMSWSDAERESGTVPLMLALAARVTGQTLTPSRFEGDFVTFPVAAWPDDLRDVPDALDRLDGRYPRELIEALRVADDAARRRAAVAVARRAVQSAECLDHPVISAVLASAADGGRMDRAAISEAVREWTWLLHLHRATSKVRNQVRAAEVLRQATHDDPLVAVFTTLSAAGHVRGLETGELAAVVARALADRLD